MKITKEKHNKWCVKIAKEKKIYVIEDTAEAIGLDYNGKKCGSFGDISTFSFYANKQITTGEGGMIATNNLKLYCMVEKIRTIVWNCELYIFPEEFDQASSGCS